MEDFRTLIVVNRDLSMHTQYATQHLQNPLIGRPDNIQTQPLSL